MATADQSPRWSSRIGQAGEDLSEIEHWFINQGVPQFMSGYSPRENMPVLFFLLLIVVAFDLAIQPWVGVSGWFLLVVPALLVGLGLIVKMTVMDQVSHLYSGLMQERAIDGQVSCLTFREQVSYLTSRSIRLAVLFAGVFFLSSAVFLLDYRIYWSNFSVDFFVVVGLLWIAAGLFRSDVWEGDVENLKERRGLYVLVLVAVILFALEGGPFPYSADLMGGVLSSMMSTAVPIPQALVALLVTVLIGIKSRGLIPKSSDYTGVIPKRQLNGFFPAVPLLILVFCAETTILPYIGPAWFASVVPLVIMVAVVPLHLLSRRRAQLMLLRVDNKGPRWPKWLKVLLSNPGVTSLINYPGAIVFACLYLVACPVMVGTLSASEGDQLSFDVLGKPPTGGAAFILAFGINLLYLGLAGGIAAFGFDRVAVWAIREAWTDWRERLSNLGVGLSLLVVFTTFLLLTAETWETMVEISTGKYLLVIGSILGLTGAFHLLTSVQHLAKKSEFGQWSEVVEAAKASRKQSKNDGASEIEDILDREELKDLKDGDPAPKHPLRPLETINGVIVMMTYEVLFFIPVMLVAAVVFLILGYITVPPGVAATWVYGDGAPASLGDALTSRPLIGQPWLRVALLLTAFSILYLAVEILSDSNRRSEFFESADNAVRRRLAVRLAYCEVLQHRWMARHVYLDAVRSRRNRRRSGHSGDAGHGRLADTSDVQQTGT